MKKDIVVQIEIDPVNHACCKSVTYVHAMSCFVGAHPDNLCPFSESYQCKLFKKNLRIKGFSILRCKACKDAEKKA